MKVTHYGIVGSNGVIQGNYVLAGTVISVEKEVANAQEAIEWLTGDKKFLHKVFDHRKSLSICTEDFCGDIQREIESVKNTNA